MLNFSQARAYLPEVQFPHVRFHPLMTAQLCFEIAGSHGSMHGMHGCTSDFYSSSKRHLELFLTIPSAVLSSLTWWADPRSVMTVCHSMPVSDIDLRRVRPGLGSPPWQLQYPRSPVTGGTLPHHACQETEGDLLGLPGVSSLPLGQGGSDPDGQYGLDL